MGERYERIRDYQERLYDWSRGMFLAEEVVFQELMELMIEPLDSVKHQWDDSETRSAVMLLLSRLFNDIEAAHRLALLGLTEQAVHGERDAVECMLLMRLFDEEPKTALRYMKHAKEYSAGTCATLLKQKGIQPPEYALYSVLNPLAHPNIYGCIAHVSQQHDSEGVTWLYHFGGHWHETWIRLALHNLLGCIAMTLVGVLPRIYAPVMTDFLDWFTRVRLAIDKLEQLGMGIETEPLDAKALKGDVRALVDKLQRKLTIQFHGFPKGGKTVYISADTGLKKDPTPR